MDDAAPPAAEAVLSDGAMETEAVVPRDSPETAALVVGQSDGDHGDGGDDGGGPDSRDDEEEEKDDDPYDLRRFIRPHKMRFEDALSELEEGCKVSHWSWYMFVTPYYPRGSTMNKIYAMKSDEEAIAFLRFKAEGVNLRQNYMRIMGAVAERLETGQRLVRLVGVVDAPKVKSSVRYFLKIAQKCNDDSLLTLMRRLASSLGLEEEDDDDTYRSKLRSHRRGKTKPKQTTDRKSGAPPPPAPPPASPDTTVDPAENEQSEGKKKRKKKAAAWTVPVGGAGAANDDGKSGVHVSGHVSADGDVAGRRPVYHVVVRSASAQKLYNLVQGYWAVIVDIREDEAYNSGHVYGAVSASELLQSRTGSGLRGKIVCYGEGEEDKLKVRDFLHDFLEANKGSRVKEAFAYEGGYEAFREKYPFSCTVSPQKGKKTRPKGRVPRLPNEIFHGELYLSGRRVALDPIAIMSLGIKAVVNATPKCPCKFRAQGVSYLRLEVEDQPKESNKLLSRLEQAFDFITTARDEKCPVLVHCAAGVSRSATIVVAYLMRKEGYTLEKALAYVKNCRPEVKPNEGFMRMLTELDNTLRDERAMLEKVDQL